MRRTLGAAVAAVFLCLCPHAPAAPGDWPEPRHDPTLTAIQPLPGNLPAAPTLLADYDLGRSRPPLTPVDNGRSLLAIVAGTLHCYDPAGHERWSSHPAGLTLTRIVSCDDLAGDGHPQIVLEAGRPAQPYGAVVALSLSDGHLTWREGVEPMSYSWQAYVSSYLPHTPGKQVLVVMQGYPPDKDNGYAALYEFPENSPPKRRWRYPFSAYTCFPAVFTTDVDGDGVPEVAVISHSRMWVLDSPTGSVKQFLGWDVSPANVRSYGLNQFVDLDGDGLDDFVCLGNFSKHYEVLLNRNHRFVEAWHQGWADSVTTAHVAVCWPAPAFADVDGDGKKELVVSVYENNTWRVRVHDPLTGRIKFEKEGLVAAALSDPTHTGHAAILCDRSHSPSRSQPDGGYDLEHTEGATLLQSRNNQLTETWHDDQAKALRTPDGLRVTKSNQTYDLHPTADSIPTLTPHPTPPPAPTPPAPEIVGTIPQELFAADLLSEGRNQLLLYTKPTATLLRVTPDHHIEKVKTFPSDCPPVIADLDGDGHPELVTVENHTLRALHPTTGEPLWQTPIPTGPSAAPWPGLLYLRSGKFLGRKGQDLFLISGEPRVVSALLDGSTGHVVWTKGELPDIQRYAGPTHNLAAAYDIDSDGKDELIFTAPDYYCVADGPTGTLKVGPLSPQTIFHQPSQGLYTLPAILPGPTPADTRVCLTAGHYFQAAMNLPATHPLWFRTPPTGQARTSKEGFLRTQTGDWLLGFGRQDGLFECIKVSTGQTRWTHDLHAAASDTVTCDLNGDGQEDFLFTTSDGHLIALTEDPPSHPRLLWTVKIPEGSAAPIIADVMGTGHPQIIVPCSDGHLRIYGSK